MTQVEGESTKTTMVAANNNSDSDNDSTADSRRRNGRATLSLKLSIPRKQVFEVTLSLANENRNFFTSSRSSYAQRFMNCCDRIEAYVYKIESLVNCIQKVAFRYDLDEKTPGNGYRSLVCVVDTCILHLIKQLRLISEQRSSMMFRAANFCKELEAYVAVLYFMTDSLTEIVKCMNFWPKTDLFPNENEYDNFKNLMQKFEDMEPSCFYGRAMGFQFCSSVTGIFHVIGMALATYSVSWETGSGAIGSILGSSRFFVSPELRAKRIVEVTKNADIYLCKGFWNLSEANPLTVCHSLA